MSCGDDKSFNRSDNTNPSTPGGLTATGATATTVNLTWSAASDNTTGIGGVQGYRIFRNGTLAKVTGNVTLVTDDGHDHRYDPLDNTAIPLPYDALHQTNKGCKTSSYWPSCSQFKVSRTVFLICSNSSLPSGTSVFNNKGGI